MKKTMLCTLLLLAATALIAAPTGNIYPFPQKISGEIGAFPVSPDKVKIIYHGSKSELSSMGEEFYWDALKSLRAASDAVEFEIHAGLLSNEEIFNLLGRKNYVLPDQGYVLKMLPSGQSKQSIVVAGGDELGLVYGLVSLSQLLTESNDSASQNHYAEVVDYPVWRHRFVSDYIANHSEEGYRFLLANKISGCAAMFQANWRDLDNPEVLARYTPALKAMKKYNEMGALEFMALLHIYQQPKTLKQLNTADENDVGQLIEACRKLAANGINHIMIGADDITPYSNENGYTPYHKEEAEQFGSIGAAHGVLMKELYNALIPEFSRLRLSMVGAPYSIEHGIGRENVDAYLIDWGKHAPREVMWVWTGKGVFSPEVTYAELAKMSDLLSGQKMFLFDNSNGFFSPLPRWETRFYPGMEVDNLGLIYMNGCFFQKDVRTGDALCYMTACDYLWNPKKYNPERSYSTAIEILMGKDAVEVVNRLRNAMIAYDVAEYSGFRDGLLSAVEFKEVLNAAEQFATSSKGAMRSSVSHIGSVRLPRAEYFESYIAPETDVLGVAADRITVDGIVNEDEWRGSAVIKLENVAASDDEPTTVRMAYDDTGIFLAFVIPISEPLPEQSKMRRDEAVYISPDAVELYLQFTPSDPANLGSYIHYCFDYEGNVFDELGNTGGVDWNGNWLLAVNKGEKEWTAELFIRPEQALASGRMMLMESNLFYIDNVPGVIPDAPRAGQIWKANFHRVENRTGKIQSWGKGGYRFHLPGYFGTLMLK